MMDYKTTSKPSGDKTQGYKRANDIVLKQITEKVKQHPWLDLSDTLRQVTTSYPKIRKTLGDVAARELHPSSASFKTNPAWSKEGQRFRIQADSSLLYPFSSSILSYVGLELGSALSPCEPHVNGSLTLALNKTLSEGRILRAFGNTHILALGSSFAVKIGETIDISHIPTFQAIKTSCPGLPAPDVHGVLKTGRMIYLFMSLAEGVSLDRIWSNLNSLQKTSIQSQLNEIFTSTRMIPQNHIYPDMELGGGQPPRCKDMRRSIRLSPSAIKNTSDFNDFLCSGTNNSKPPVAWARMIRSFLSDTPTILITHGDLHPRNIMVSWSTLKPDNICKQSDLEYPDSDIQITAIIDWECCGCYPEYWEYVKALNTIGPKDPFSDWFEYLPTKAIGTWPSELAIDMLLSRWLN